MLARPQPKRSRSRRESLLARYSGSDCRSRARLWRKKKRNLPPVNEAFSTTINMEIDFFSKGLAQIIILTTLLLELQMPSTALAAGITTLKTEAEKKVVAPDSNSAATKAEPQPAATPVPGKAVPKKTEENKEDEVEDKDNANESEAAPVKPDFKIVGPSTGGFFFGLGLGTMKVPQLDTYSLWSGELGLSRHFAPVATSGSFWGTFRYAATEFNAIEDSVSFRGIVELFAVGGQLRLPIGSDLDCVAGSEIGAVKISIRDLTRFERDSGLTRPGVVLNLFGGLEWANSQRTSLGTKLLLGVGRVRSVGLGLSASYYY